eukprot:scaffold1136_cov399-Prasinococcus_capsulatus_cf.AAC.10
MRSSSTWHMGPCPHTHHNYHRAPAGSSAPAVALPRTRALEQAARPARREEDDGGRTVPATSPSEVVGWRWGAARRNEGGNEDTGGKGRCMCASLLRVAATAKCPARTEDAPEAEANLDATRRWTEFTLRHGLGSPERGSK